MLTVNDSNTINLTYLFNRGPEDTCFEGGVFPAILSFPHDYPLSPPKMRFTGEMFHPNGKQLVCGPDGFCLLAGRICWTFSFHGSDDLRCEHSCMLCILWRGCLLYLIIDLLLQFTQMGEFASQFYMHQVMTPWDMRAVQSGGVLFRVLRRFSSLLSACWQVKHKWVMLLTRIWVGSWYCCHHLSFLNFFLLFWIPSSLFHAHYYNFAVPCFSFIVINYQLSPSSLS